MVAGLPSKPRVGVPTWPSRLGLGLYMLAWHVGLPAVLAYFWIRGRREPLYRQFLGERFGRISGRLQRPIWLHSASLGEIRGVMPLIDEALTHGFEVLITTLTPAGRQAAMTRYAESIKSGRVQVSYLPLELPWAVRAFAKSVNPRCVLSSEIDTWPILSNTLKKMGIPLGIVNAQYPQKSYAKDQGWAGVRSQAFRSYDLVLCKSELHAQRFKATGCTRVQVVGELRFDLPAPPLHIKAAADLRNSQPALFGNRPVICMASVVEGEDELVLTAFEAFARDMLARGLSKPLLVYVPRSPQRFEAAAQLLISRGLTFLQRSSALDRELRMINAEAPAVDVFLGDSLGEMYFYLALADTVTVCGSFVPRGSHNIIEPLALSKPVIVGPSIWGIEYPGQEALAAGVLTQVPDAHALPARWLAWFTQPALQIQSRQQAQAFIRQHSGSVEKHWQHLSAWLSSHA